MPKAPPTPAFSTKKGNASFALAGVDGRSLMARRFREIVISLETDLGDTPTEAQRHIMARAATLALWCEAEETKLADGSDFDAAGYATISNALRRLLCDLGLERRMRDVTPTLEQYLAGKAAQ